MFLPLTKKSYDDPYLKIYRQKLYLVVIREAAKKLFFLAARPLRKNNLF